MSYWTTFTSDREEYSRYEPEHRRIVVHLVPNDDVYTPADGERVVVRLYRNDGYGNVGQVEQVLAGEETSLTLSLAVESFLDDLGFYCARAGSYTLYVDTYDVANTLVDTQAGPTVYLSLVTVDQLRTLYLFGIPLYASEVLAPLDQPSIGGVTIVGVSSAHPRGLFTLTCTVAGAVKTLAWGSGGTAVDVSAGGRFTVGLGDIGGREYITVRVAAHLLPATTSTCQVALDRKQLEDADLRLFVSEAAGWMITKTHIVPEPTILATPLRMAEGWYDDVAEAVGYYRPTNLNRWLEIALPYYYLLHVYSLKGYMNGTLSLDLSLDWIVHSEQQGTIELVPKGGAITTWHFWGTNWTLWSARPHIPEFWQYRILAGMRNLDDERAVVRRIIASRAAMDIATMAGEALTGGRTSYSVGRDGITESRSFAPGVWAKRMELWAKDLDEKALRDVKRHLIGLPTVVLV